MTKYKKENLNEVVIREKEFHEDFYKKAYISHSASNFQVPRVWIDKAQNPSSIPLDYWEYAFHLLGDLKGKKVVEVGCGDGWITTCLASTGAVVYTFDISLNGCVLTTKKLDAHGLPHGFVGVMDAHSMAFKDSTIDAVFIAGVLHHLDIAKVANEAYRVLKNNGILVGYEPLSYGPVMWTIRKIWHYLNGKKEYTWTQDEDPLQEKDLDPFREYFKENYIRRFNFIAKTNRLKKRFGPLANTLRWTDYILLSVFPLFRRYCTCIVFRFIK